MLLISSIALSVPFFLGALHCSPCVQFCDPCNLCENSNNVTADVHNHLSADSTKFWTISLISGIIGCAFSSVQVLSDCWALKTLREETPQGRDSLTWKKFGYMKAIAAIGDFLAMLVKQADSSYSSHAFTKLLPYMIVSVFVMVDLFVLWCSFQERIPLADGIQEDREQTDSINQGVNSYSCGVFRNIKDIWVGSANICLFLVPMMLAGFGRGLASRQFPRILEEVLTVRCDFPGTFKKVSMLD